MTEALILHGWPDRAEYFDPSAASPSNRHWLPWLQRQLLLRGILAQTPEWPEAWRPRYEAWKRVFERFPVGPDTLLVGHSCGAGFLVRWLGEHPTRVRGLVLVAPFLDPDRERAGELDGFFDFQADPGLPARTGSTTIFVSEDDALPMLRTAEVLQRAWEGTSVRWIRMQGKGHFTDRDMKTDRFPELLDAALAAVA